MTGPTTIVPERLPPAPADAGTSPGRKGTGDAHGGFKAALSRVGGDTKARGQAAACPAGAQCLPTIGSESASGGSAAPIDQIRSGTPASECRAGGEGLIAVASGLEAEAADKTAATGDDRSAGATTACALEQLAAVFASLGPAAKDAGTPDGSAAVDNNGGDRTAFGKGAMSAVRFVLAKAEELRGLRPDRGDNPSASSTAGSAGRATIAASAAVTPDGTMAVPDTIIGTDKVLASVSPALPGALTPVQAPSVTVLRRETHLPPVTQVAEQVVEMLEAAAGKPSGPKDATRILELQLRPAELGTVRVSLRLNDGRLEVELRTERTETGQMLERDRPRLAKALADAGYQTDSLAVSSIGERPHVRVAAGPQLSPGAAGDFGAALGGGTASGGNSAGNGAAPAAPFTSDEAASGRANDAERIDDGQAHDRDGLYL